MMPLVLIGAVAKILVSAALTIRTRLWWLPGAGMMIAGAAIARAASPGLGMFGIALGAAAVTTTGVVRRRAHFVQSTDSHRF